MSLIQMDPKIVNAKVLKHTGNDLNIPCLGGETRKYIIF